MVELILMALKHNLCIQIKMDKNAMIIVSMLHLQILHLTKRHK